MKLFHNNNIKLRKTLTNVTLWRMHDCAAQSHTLDIFALMFDYHRLEWPQHLERLAYIRDPSLMFHSFCSIFLQNFQINWTKTNNKHHSTQHTRFRIFTFMTVCSFDIWRICMLFCRSFVNVLVRCMCVSQIYV